LKRFYIFKTYLQTTIMLLETLQDFYQLCYSRQGAFLGVDYGTKKLGLAISASNRSFAMPLEIISSLDAVKMMAHIAGIIKSQQVIGIVMGLPINMDGTNSLQTQAVQNFSQKLSEELDIPIFLQDERLSSKAADNLLKDLGFKRAKRNQLDDMLAASLILDSALQRMMNIHHSK